MDYQIIALSRENIKDLKYLYKAVFNNDVSLDFIHKKFDTTYLGKSYFGHLAYDNGNPIAFHGAIPMLMEFEGKKELAAQYGDAMTLANYTGKGLFTKLGKLTDTQLKEAGIRFVWGFPNQNSEYGYLNKLDWLYQERMCGFSIKTSGLPIEKLSRVSKISNKLYQKHITDVFNPYKTQASINGSVFKNNHVVSTVRDQNYYDYKAFGDNFTIELHNSLFWLKVKNGILIGDIEITNEEDFDKALDLLKKIASKNGIGYITFQSSPNTLISSLLEKRTDHQFQSWVVGYKNFNSDFPLEKLKLTFGDLDTF
ncbi:GNAT family N-acetyltransferase [Aquimarina sp. MMG016]|uniref:GNAT family N-acetyltransferase n=1 Tax=Aquimarina sp. MMG016 TaxID=2822690 RepID=UPI001B3A31A1|nr:GNAT family N-acetyltransferase [Aquimarina sp. MMG016]MBQ4821775.1 GNAT family N-acetyltransferase [Aquimarina sp. MMG016]